MLLVLLLVWLWLLLLHDGRGARVGGRVVDEEMPPIVRFLPSPSPSCSVALVQPSASVEDGCGQHGAVGASDARSVVLGRPVLLCTQHVAQTHRCICGNQRQTQVENNKSRTTNNRLPYDHRNGERLHIYAEDPPRLLFIQNPQRHGPHTIFDCSFFAHKHHLDCGNKTVLPLPHNVLVQIVIRHVTYMLQ